MSYQMENIYMMEDSNAYILRSTHKTRSQQNMNKIVDTAFYWRGVLRII